MLEITLGQVAISKAGRDKGRTFIIWQIVDDTFVLIVDGDLRRVERPKKKRIKHLKFTEDIIEKLNEKLIKNDKITNSEIRRTLVGYIDEDINS